MNAFQPKFHNMIIYVYSRHIVTLSRRRKDVLNTKTQYVTFSEVSR